MYMLTKDIQHKPQIAALVRIYEHQGQGNGAWICPELLGKHFLMQKERRGFFVVVLLVF